MSDKKENAPSEILQDRAEDIEAERMYEQLQANGSNIFNDPKATLAERDAEIKRLTEESQDLRNDRFNATELLKTSESEIARLRAEVEKIATEHGLIRWETYNREKHGDEIGDEFGLEEGNDRIWVSCLTDPFALVPVEDSVIVEDELKPRWDEKCCCEPGSGCSLCGGDSTPKAEDKP